MALDHDLPTPDDVEPARGDVVTTILPSQVRCDICDRACFSDESIRLGRCGECRRAFRG